MPLDGIADGLFGHCGVCGVRGPANSLEFELLGFAGLCPQAPRPAFGVKPATQKYWLRRRPRERAS